MNVKLATPTALTDITPEWIDDRRAVAQRDGHALRAGIHGGLCTIEVQAINTGLWHPLTLPNGGITFITPAARNTVLLQLQSSR